MEKIGIANGVVLYIETVESRQYGTFHNIKTNDKAYANEDMLSVITHVLNGAELVSFFPADLEAGLRQDLLRQCQDYLSELEVSGFIGADRSGGLVKTISAGPPLRVLFLETTKNCNLRCKHCYVTDCQKPKNNEQLTYAEIIRIINEANKLGVMEIQLTGGEFFMIPQAWEILEELGRRLIPCSIFTNGTLLPDRVLEYLKGAPGGLIFYISIDGPETVHDEFRGSPGAYRKTIKTVKTLLEIGCDVRINTTVGNHNVDCMQDFIAYIESEFGALHRLVAIDPIGRASGKNELKVSPEKFAELLSGNGENFKFLDSHDTLAEGEWDLPACGIGSAMMFIDAYGNASLCPTLTQEQNPAFLAGNIRRASLKEIWEQAPIYNKFRSVQCREVAGCQFRELCKGGCRSKAYISSGDLNAPDTQMCLTYGKTV